MGAQPRRGRCPFLARRLEDPELRARVEAAERLGISLARFEGWEPVTAYTYDGDRLVSSQPEPEWDEQQQGWMLALATYRASRCPHCGRDLQECGQAGRWTVPPPRRCHATDALLMAQESSKHLRPGALLWRVEPKR